MLFLAEFEPFIKTEYRPARVAMRGVGAFDDTPDREIPSCGRWRRVSRCVTPSDRVAAHLWCAPCVTIANRRAFGCRNQNESEPSIQTVIEGLEVENA